MNCCCQVEIVGAVFPAASGAAVIGAVIAAVGPQALPYSISQTDGRKIVDEGSGRGSRRARRPGKTPGDFSSHSIGVNIQVIGGLVEDQQIRLFQQQAAERGARLAWPPDSCRQRQIVFRRP